MDDYETVAYGKNIMELTPTGKEPAKYENVAIEQTPARKKPEHPKEKRGRLRPNIPLAENRVKAGTGRVKIVVLCVIGVILLVACVTALVVSFVQLSEKTKQLKAMQEQLTKSETERDRMFQLIENMETRLNKSESMDAAQSSLSDSLNMQLQNLNQTVFDNRLDMDAAQSSLSDSLNRQLQNLNKTVLDHLLPVCPSAEYRYNPHSGSCYRAVVLIMNWTESRDYCIASGEFLATFDTAESVEWFGNMRSSNAWGVGSTYLWVGGYKLPAGWKWNGRVTVPVDSSVWTPGYPNLYDCMCSYGYDYQYKKFFAYACSSGRFFMCETQKIFA